MKDINFFVAAAAKDKKHTQAALFALAFFVVLAITAATYLIFSVQLMSINNDTKQITAAVNTPKAYRTIQQYKIYTDNIAALKRYDNLIGQATANLNSTHNFNAEVLQTITASLTPTAKMTYLSYSGNVVNISFNVQTLQEAAALIVNLKAASIFESVSCNTYSQTGGTAQASATSPYAITVVATLNGGGTQ